MIQTRHYRAPEVVLGLKWSYPCDLWSLGCILLELTETRLTFDTHDTAQHLAMIERLCGPIPHRLVRKIPEELASVRSLFDQDGACARTLRPNPAPERRPVPDPAGALRYRRARAPD